MTDHADTIRREELTEPCDCPQGMRFHALNCSLRPGQRTIGSLVAERQQAVTKAQLADSLLPANQDLTEQLERCRAERQQAIDERDAAEQRRDAAEQAFDRKCESLRQVIDALRAVSEERDSWHDVAQDYKRERDAALERVHREEQRLQSEVVLAERARCEQAIDALREAETLVRGPIIDSPRIVLRVRRVILNALLSLGETP